MWCDASSIAVGICVEIGGVVVEDACWLRQKDDTNHINLAELDAANRALKEGVKWGIRELELLTDSATVTKWLSSALSGREPIRSQALSEILIRRRVGLFKQVVEEEKLKVTITLVRSEENKADALTRVPSSWWTLARNPAVAAAVTVRGQWESVDGLKQLHEMHHFGVRRSMFLARKIWGPGKVSEDQIRAVIQECEQCASIDPSPIQWEKGDLGVRKSWTRVAVDVTHVGAAKFLTMVDCGPGRFMIRHQIATESEVDICSAMNSVWNEFGPPEEVILDNYCTFRGSGESRLLERVGIEAHFRCVNRPSGNGIVERGHRTIKRMVARSNRPVGEMVAWYNATPNASGVIPASTIFAHRRRLLLPKAFNLTNISRSREIRTKVFRIGDEVFVKPAPPYSCMSQWRRATITGLHLPHQVEVDGRPYHVSHVRLAPPEARNDDVGRTKIRDTGDPRAISESNDRDGPQAVECELEERVESPVGRPQRAIRRPARFEEFVCTGIQASVGDRVPPAQAVSACVP